MGQIFSRRRAQYHQKLPESPQLLRRPPLKLEPYEPQLLRYPYYESESLEPYYLPRNPLRLRRSPEPPEPYYELEDSFSSSLGHKAYHTDADDATKELSRDDIVIADKSVSFTNDAKHSFQLQECGLSLDFPKGMITPPVESAPVGYDVTVKGLWGGKFVFPEGAQLISSVTSVSLIVPSSLNKPVTVQLMHCASITDQFQSKYLSFVMSHSGQSPFKFELLQGGDFPVGSQYGTIQLKKFCLIAIVCLRNLIANASAAAGIPLNVLSAGLALGGAVVIAHAKDLQPSCYYQEIEYHRNDPPHRVLLSLGVSLDLPWAVELFEKKLSFLGTKQRSRRFRFSKDRDVDNGVLCVTGFPTEPKDGWTVIPLTDPPVISEKNVQDVFEGRSTQIPCVQVSVKAHPNTDGFKDDFHCALTINGISINGSIHGAPKIVIEKSLSDISEKKPSPFPFLPSPSEDSIDINAVRQKLEQVLTKNQVMLNDIISLTPSDIARELLQIGIISPKILSSSAHEPVSSEKIIKSFMVILNTKTSIADLDEQCVKFLKGLSNVGGPASEVAELIRKEWLEVVGRYNVRLSM